MSHDFPLVEPNPNAFDNLKILRDVPPGAVVRLYEPPSQREFYWFVCREQNSIHAQYLLNLLNWDMRVVLKTELVQVHLSSCEVADVLAHALAGKLCPVAPSL